MKGKQCPSTRADGWKPIDDEKLTEIVLQHIRNGSTQLKAFNDAAEVLGRTSAACGFRWNGVLRKQYRAEIEAAKQHKRDVKKPEPASKDSVSSPVSLTSAGAMREVIDFLNAYVNGYEELQKRAKKLMAECGALRDRVKILETQSAPQGTIMLTPEQIVEDTKTLMAIMERARKVLEQGPSLPIAE